MEEHELQHIFLDAIKTVVTSEMSKSTGTNSKIGVVVKEPVGFECVVLLNKQETKCQLPEHLHSWIQKGDIVIVQDLYGDGSKRVVTGKTGDTHQQPSLVFEDSDTGKLISGRDAVYDETGNNNLSTFGTIEES